LEGTYKAMGVESRNSVIPQFTDHCFTGDYPVAVDELINMEIIKK